MILDMRPMLRGEVDRIKIDYLFYRGLECRSVKTIGEVVSDHLPIIAEFDFLEK